MVQRSVKGLGGATVNDGDEELVRRAACGDTFAIGGLYDRYAALVLAIAARVLTPISEAEDLMQDVFLEIWREASRYDASRGTVRAWILTKTRSRALDRRIQDLRRRRAVDPYVAIDDHQYTDDRIASERRALREEFAMLPPSQRRVLELVYAEGLSTHEVAQQIGTPLGTVKSRIAYGLARLRSRLRVTSTVPRVAPPRGS